MPSKQSKKQTQGNCSRQSAPQSTSDTLPKIRHSSAHLLAAAVIKLFPKAKLGTGPATSEGFFYDMQTPRPLTAKDFPAIEREMQKMIEQDLSFVCQSLAVKSARQLFEKAGQAYKVQLIDDLAKEGNKKVSIYKTGTDFTDLCAGPHVKSAGQIGAFKLLSVAGAYWQGNQSNPQMSRVYGTAFGTKKELERYLKMREEAKKRDHKKLGVELDLFTFSPLVGSGLPLWTPKGALMRRLLDDFVWQLRKKRGYMRVEIPHITKKDLYEVSGHWEKFQEELFKIKTREGHLFALKPMNCPHHTQIYARRPRSYRELPVRYANTTMVYRDEQSGELSGLVRVRAITQDDAHVFCRYSQVKDEIFKIWDIVQDFYSPLGFDIDVRLSLHDPKQLQKYLGTPKIWQQAEEQMRSLIKEKGVTAEEAVGEAALYGPKIDFITHDSLGRSWQIATIQLDMNLPERFDLTATNEQGKPERIVMLHAAIMGSLERFMAILIEHFAGAFPLWLAPVQVAILPISTKHLDYAEKVAAKLSAEEIRVEVDREADTIGKKIRRAELQKIPYLLIVGDKEVKANSVAVRRRAQGDLGSQKIDSLIKKIVEETQSKAL